MKNLNKTLGQLDGEDWGKPTYNSHLVQTTFELRKKPLKDFTTEDLRIMVGQNFSLEYLMPIAIERLKDNILADGDYYFGDLLVSVLRSDANYWTNHKGFYQAVDKLYQDNLVYIESRVGVSNLPALYKDTLNEIKASYNRFRELNIC